MRVKLFQIYDKVAESVSGPIMAFNREGPAIREFQSVLEMGDKTNPGRYPDNYELRAIGFQETDTGQLEPFSVPETTYTGEEWLALQDRNAKLAALREVK